MPLPDPLTAAQQRASAQDAEQIINLQCQLAEAHEEIDALVRTKRTLVECVESLESQLMTARAALASVPKIAAELYAKWDEGMRAGKLLIALMDPSLKYRADVTAIHAALAQTGEDRQS